MIALLLALASPVTITPKTAAEAVSLADANPERGTTGVYRVKIAAAARGADAVYLNSNADYRAADDLTVHLTLAAAHTLAKRLGAPVETALIGRTILVHGAVRSVPIYNAVGGRARDYNRNQHTILIFDSSKITVE